MSAAISFSQPTRSRVRPASARVVPTRPASEATYRRRRAMVGIVLAMVAAVGIVLTHDVLAGSSGAPASAAAGQPAHTLRSVTVQPGDTLWSIAQVNHGSVPITRYVDKLVDLNGGPSIQAGQAVRLP
jgi:LysM repeat protein